MIHFHVVCRCFTPSCVSCLRGGIYHLRIACKSFRLRARKAAATRLVHSTSIRRVDTSIASPVDGVVLSVYTYCTRVCTRHVFVMCIYVIVYRNRMSLPTIQQNASRKCAVFALIEPLDSSERIAELTLVVG